VFRKLQVFKTFFRILGWSERGKKGVNWGGMGSRDVWQLWQLWQILAIATLCRAISFALQGNFKISRIHLQGDFKISRTHFQNPCKAISSFALYHIYSLEKNICS
jgi:hypothetical protein